MTCCRIVNSNIATQSNDPHVSNRFEGVLACLRIGVFLHFPYELGRISVHCLQWEHVTYSLSQTGLIDTTSDPALLIWKEVTLLKNNQVTHNKNNILRVALGTELKIFPISLSVISTYSLRI